MFEHSQVDLVTFCLTADHFHRVAATQKAFNNLIGIICDLLDFISVFDVINWTDFHSIIRQSPRFIKTKSFHSSADHSFFALCPHNSISVESDQTERVGQVEIDGIRSGKGVGYVIEKLEHDHDSVDLNAENEIQGGDEDDDHDHSLLDHEDDQLFEEFGESSRLRQYLSDDAASFRGIADMDCQSERILFERFHVWPFVNPVLTLFALLRGP